MRADVREHAIQVLLNGITARDSCKSRARALVRNPNVRKHVGNEAPATDRAGRGPVEACYLKGATSMSSHRIPSSALAAILCLSASGTALAQSLPGSAGGTAPTAVAPGDEVIVTGTRATGITAAESATPIKLLGQEAIAHVGQPNLNQVLTQLVPSFTAQALGGDTANLTLSARLRGLSPNHTLVMVNGKRRHGTANLAVLGGPYQGGAAPDLDLISPSSIKRIEVLEDGAAAQYGSDAIAGVINIILKDDAEGVSGYGTYGKYYDAGGETYAGTVHMATRLGDRGFTNITIFHRSVDFTQVGGLVCASPIATASSTTAIPAIRRSAPPRATCMPRSPASPTSTRSTATRSPS